jgi:hypothetical protein
MGPSKRPTADEQRWIDAIVDMGCVACLKDGFPGVPGQVHHIVEANKRLGHRYTLCLCSPGHHQPDSRSGKIALHPGRSKKFTARYGTERELLAWCGQYLGFE